MDDIHTEALLEGPIARGLFRLAWPVVATFLLQWTFEVVDTAWVGHLPDAQVPLAALSISVFVAWLLNSVIHLLSIGTTTLVAQALGSKKRQGARRLASRCLALGLPFGVVITLAGLLAIDPLLDYLDVGAVVAGEARSYLRVLVLGAPLTVWMMTFDAVQRGAGDTLTPLRIGAVAFGLNALLDPVLIFGLGPLPALGIEGAAIASLTARGVGVLAYCRLARRGRLLLPRRPEAFAFDWQTARRCARIGLPVSILGVLFMVVYIELVRILAPFGPAAVAAFGIGGRIEGLLYVMASGLGVATQTAVGQNVGAGQPERAIRVSWRATAWGVVMGLGAGFIMMAFPEPLVRLLANEASPETIAYGIEALRITAPCQPFMAVEIVLTAAFAGVGHTLPPMLNSVPNNLARIPIAIALVAWTTLGATAIFWTISLTCVARGVVAVIWFRMPGWRRKYLGA